MRITGYQTHPVRVVQQGSMTGTHIVLRIQTEEGIDGVTFVSRLNEVTLAPTVLLLQNMLAPLVGDDPLDAEGLYRRIYRLDDAVAGTPVGLEARAASAIDAALWDIRGKVAGMPVYRLLGGSRQRLPVSANWGVDHGQSAADLERNMQRHLDTGFRSFKFRGGHLTRQQLADHMHALRDIAGPDVQLCVDGNQRWSVKQTIEMLDAVEDCEPYWIEDPVPHHDVAGLQELRGAVATRICAGEVFQSIPQHRRMLEERAVDILMIDMDLGISGFRRVAALAEAYCVPVVNHLAAEVLAHALAAAPTGHVLGFNSWAQALFAEPVQIEDGEFVLSDRPGLGLELDEEALTRFAVS